MFERYLGFSRIPPERRRNTQVPAASELLRSNKNEWTELQPFQKGTIGEEVFPQEEFEKVLAGRRRSPRVLDRPLGDLWPQVSFPPQLKEIEAMPIKDFLALPSDAAYAAVRVRYPHLKSLVHDYLRNLAISPAVSVLNDVLRRQQVPILPQNEEIAERILEDTFNKMVEDPRRRTTNFITKAFVIIPISEKNKKFRRRMVQAIRLHYGLPQGLPQTYMDICKTINRDSSTVEKWVYKGIWNMGRKHIADKLKAEMPA